MKRLFTAALALFFLATPAYAQDPVEATYVLTGFRSADFGSNEDQVRSAINSDFGLSGDAVDVIENDIQRTRAFVVRVDDLLPDSGTAQVSYILGFRSNALTQVSVTWGGQVDPDVDARALVAMANQLRIHFAGQGYAIQAANTSLGDGRILIFQGRDATGRMTLLTLDAPATPEGADAPPRLPSLQLAYMESPEEPDVFQIDTGQF